MIQINVLKILAGVAGIGRPLRGFVILDGKSLRHLYNEVKCGLPGCCSH